MANAYNSCWTGAHNDEYNARIMGLEGKATTFTAQITTLNNKATTFTAQITTLQESTTALSTTMNTKVAKAGDTMTGTLNIKDSRITSGITATVYGNSVRLVDSDGVPAGVYDTWHTTAQSAVRLYSQNKNSSGTAIWNVLTIGFNNSDKSRFISVSESKPWREAISVSTYSMVPGSSNSNISFTSFDSTSTWKTFFSGYTAPSNGYIGVYFTGSTRTPAFYLQDNTNGLQNRGNGNGGRDYGGFLPATKGHTYQGECVNCKVNWLRFFPAATGL